MRDYLGVDWADAEHAVWVEDEAGTKIMSRTVPHTGEGLAVFGRWLDDRRSAALKAYCPRAVEVVDGLKSGWGRDFLGAYPTPAALATLTERRWQRWARAHRLSGARAAELWPIVQRPQLGVPAHVVRVQAPLVGALLEHLGVTVGTVDAYRER